MSLYKYYLLEALSVNSDLHVMSSLTHFLLSHDPVSLAEADLVPSPEYGLFRILLLLSDLINRSFKFFFLNFFHIY